VTTSERTFSLFVTDDPFVTQLSLVVRPSYRVRSLDELVSVACSKLRGERVLDLIGHSDGYDRLMTVGPDVVDARCQRVRDAFKTLRPLLQRRKVRALRLLGCGTATRDAGRRTLIDLARILAPTAVFGTVDQLGPRSFDQSGLSPSACRLLISAADLR
jgi:hypothetical protein